MFVYLIMAKKTTFPLDNYSLAVRAVLLLYIVLPVTPPAPISSLISSPLGHVMSVIVALAIFAAAGPITGVLALLAVYVLLGRSVASSAPIELYQDTVSQQPPTGVGHTLEERVVSEMAPAADASITEPASYLPVLTALHGVGSPVNVDD